MVISETHPSHSASAHQWQFGGSEGASIAINGNHLPIIKVEERRRSHQWQLGGREGASIAIKGNHLPIIEVEERRRGMGSWDPRLGLLESRRPRARACGEVRARRGERLHADPQRLRAGGHERVRAVMSTCMHPRRPRARTGTEPSVAISGNQWPSARTGTEQCSRSADVRRIQPLVARSVPVGKGAPW